MRRLALGAAALFVVFVTLLSCVNEPTAPRETGIRYASGLRFTAVFPSILQQAGAADLVSFERVHVVLRHSDGTMALDTTIVFPPDRNEINLALSVRLLPGTPASGELMTLALDYLNAANEIVFRGGPVTITALPSLPGQAPPPPVSIPVVYAGAGASARAVRISPRALSVNAGEAFSYTATAVDAAGATVPATPIFWTSLDVARATITSPAQGSGRALAVRGTARIVASLITGQADTVILAVQPVPATLAAVSGSGQTGTVGKPAATTLAQPLVVRVTATDGLPVQGVAVSFAATSGSGSVAPAAATTDANGLAQTSWTLGTTVGAQTVTVTSASLAGSPMTFGATGQAAIATRLAYTSSPTEGTNIAAGATLGLVVVARDIDGDAVSSFTGNVTLSLATSPTGATLGGTTTVAAVAGVATFANVTLGMPGTGYVLAASATGLTGASSAAFNVVTGPATNMVLVTGSGQTAAAGSALAPITVALTDASGNAKGNVPIAFAITSGGGSVTPATVNTNASGRAVATWTLGASAGTQTLGVTSLGVTPLSVSATATNSQLSWVITNQPGVTQTAGVVVTPAVVAELRNASNVVASSFTGAATLSLSGNVNGATLAGTVSVNAVNGVATFSSVSIGKSGSGYSLTVTSTGTLPATSSVFAVQPNVAVGITLQSGNGQTANFSAPLAQPIVALVADAFGNAVAGSTVSFAVASGGGSVAPASVSTSATGLASTTWTLGASGTQTMTVASTGLTGSPITVSATGGAAPGPVASTVVTPAVDTLGSIGDTRQITAVARDAANNIVTGTWTWVSRTPSVATVSASGLVTSLTNGSARIVATETGGSKDSAQVVVQQRIASINVNPAVRSLYTGGNFTFSALAVDGRGNAMASQPTFTWSSLANSVATVNASTGVANAVAIGSTQIRATSGASVGVSNLTVRTPITRIDVSFDSTNAAAPDNFTMTALGNRRMYRAVARDTLLNVMSGVTFTWSSTNASVAGIDSTTATQARATAAANGVTSIQAGAQGVTGAATLNVAQVLSSIDLSPVSAIVAVSGTTLMVARGKDANARFISGGTFAFSSSTPAIATINGSTGLVTGVANGTTNITAASGAITSNTAVISVSGSGPAIISFGRDTIGVGRGTALSVPILLSKPNAANVTVNLAVADTFAFWSAASVTIPAGQTSVNATLNGRNAGTSRLTALDGSGTGYAGDTAIVAVQANLRMTTTSYSLNANDQLSTQVLLSDPSPAGGTYVTFSYGTAGRASVSPDPAFIPAGQLAADVVIRGLTAGNTTITPSATGVSGNAATAFISAPNLFLAVRTLRLGNGQFNNNVYAQVPNNLFTPLTITLTSTDTAVATVPPSVVIPTNQNYVFFNTSARGRGTALIIASAPGWRPDTFTVLATTPMARICCNANLNVTSPAQNVTVYAADSLRSINTRTSSLAVRLSSSDTAVARVLDTLVTIAAGNSSISSGRVIPGGVGGTAWIKATAGGHIADSVLFTVVGPRVTFSYTSGRLGLGQQESGQYVLIPNAVASGVLVTLTNSDSSIVGAPTTIAIPANQNYAYFLLRGKALGSATFIATAPGYSPDTTTTIVTTPRIDVTGGGTLNAYSSGSAYVYTRDSVNTLHNRITPLTVRLVSSDTMIIRVDTVLTIPAGQYYSNVPATVVAVNPGTARIIGTAPGHFSDSVTFTVQPAKLELSWTTYRIGARQSRQANDFYVYLPNQRGIPVPVTLTQTRPASVALSATALTIPANSNVQYFTFSGLTTGRDTIIATAPGYLPDTAVVIVTTPRFSVTNLPGQGTTTDPPRIVTVYVADSLGGNHYASDTVVVRAVSTDSSVLRPSAPFFRILRGEYYAQPTVLYVGAGTARIVYSDSAGTGYRPDTTNLVTVTGPSLSICCGNPGRLGMRQRTNVNQYYVQLPNNVAAPLVVSLTSTDPRVATVPATVTVPAGSYYAFFTITAQDTLGTIQIQATATGYSATSVNMQVTAPKFIVSTSTTRNTTSGSSALYVYAADALGTQHDVNENVVVTLNSSAPGVASIDSSTVTIVAGNSNNSNARWTPVAVGTAQLSATDARAAYYAYGAGTVNVNVVTPQAYLSFSTMTLGIGQFEDVYVQLPDNTATALVVPITRAAVPRTTTPATVTIPANSSYEYFRVTGSSAGNDTITVSPPGHLSRNGTVIVGLGRIDPISNWPATLRVGDSVQVTLYARSADQNVRNVAAATTFALSSNSLLQFVSGGAASAPITSAVVAANGSQVSFYVKAVSAGSGTGTITNANYSTYTNTVSVTP